MNQIYDNEIDLLDLFIIIWDGKWKIIAFVIISVLGVIFFQSTQPEKFDAVSQIKPITSAEADTYIVSNNLGFFYVSPDLLLNMYIEQLDERILFEDAIREVKLLDIEEYEDKEQYEKAIITLASKIEIFSPKILDDSLESGVREFSTITFKYQNSEKWKLILSTVNNTASQNVKKILKQRFLQTLKSARLERDYAIEDIKTKIANSISDYNRISSDRLAYLREQASIARKIGVAMNTVESQTFDTQYGVMTNIAIDKPFYLRGYKAIEEEIALIEARKDKKSFINGLFDLETKLRSLKQDQELERAENIFASTPIASTKINFSAATMSVGATEFFYQYNSKLYIIFTVVIAGMIGMTYVLISNSLRKRNNKIA